LGHFVRLPESFQLAGFMLADFEAVVQKERVTAIEHFIQRRVFLYHFTVRLIFLNFFQMSETLLVSEHPKVQKTLVFKPRYAGTF
jgi:hypothetical protein